MVFLKVTLELSTNSQTIYRVIVACYISKINIDLYVKYSGQKDSPTTGHLGASCMDVSKIVQLSMYVSFLTRTKYRYVSYNIDFW